jgi:hypothetical protein
LKKAHIAYATFWLVICKTDTVPDLDPAYYLGADADPDPAFHFDADPDPYPDSDPTFQFDADPDPQHWLILQEQLCAFQENGSHFLSNFHLLTYRTCSTGTGTGTVLYCTCDEHSVITVMRHGVLLSSV